ncbi:MAG: hypothetical protein CM15mP8_3680 [Methanobacteriota archaeon]|nr:MAG: hypothetical protein CM15mP8_3680 [Euryarchaeota archaeon]
MIITMYQEQNLPPNGDSKKNPFWDPKPRAAVMRQLEKI